MRAHARYTDPQTSHDAARSIGDTTPNQAAVLKLMKFMGGACTDADLVPLYYKHERELRLPEQSPSGIRTRRKELTTAGLVRDSGRTVLLDSNRKAIVWEVMSVHDRARAEAARPQQQLVPLGSDEELF